MNAGLLHCDCCSTVSFCLLIRIFLQHYTLLYAPLGELLQSLIQHHSNLSKNSQSRATKEMQSSTLVGVLERITVGNFPVCFPLADVYVH